MKEAETLLNKTKHERNNLLVENHAPKKTNTELRRQVIEAEQDTQQARVELEITRTWCRQLIFKKVV